MQSEDDRFAALADSFDPSHVHTAYEGWPEEAAKTFDRRVELRGEFERVAFFGLGGSAAAGDILSDWLLASGATEFSVFKGKIPRVPPSKTLFIACSASGNTDETVKFAENVAQRGGALAAISSGGRLAEVAQRNSIPHFAIQVSVAPRFSLPGMLFSTLAVLNAAGILRGLEAELQDALVSLRQTRERVRLSSGKDNPAKTTAVSIWKRTPCIYGSSLTRGVALRFKNSLNENAKVHSSASSSPELFHNEVESWEGGEQGFVPVFLRHRAEPGRERSQFTALRELITERGVSPVEAWGEARTRFGEMLSLCYSLDFASYYLALLRSVDPCPIKTIERLKGVSSGYADKLG